MTNFMKNFKYYFSLLIIPLFLSCNSDDDNNPEPEPEPIVANAKILQWGRCTPDHNWVEFYDPDPNIFTVTSGSFLNDLFDVPEEFWIDDLEVYVEYELIPEEEIPFCPTDSASGIPVRVINMQLPTPQEDE